MRLFADLSLASFWHNILSTLAHVAGSTTIGSRLIVALVVMVLALFAAAHLSRLGTDIDGPILTEAERTTS